MERLIPVQNVTVPDSTELKHEFISRTLMTVPISQISTYDKKPRREKNPNFEQIKESIWNDGMNQPLVITKRPGEEKFMIFKGGNTRLSAVRELFEETGDRRFKFVDCSFFPWTGFESDAIIGHLQENEMRKSLCFIDRAHGVKVAIEHLKIESEDDDLSLRKCLELLSQKGFSTTLSTISIMMYAVDNVEPLLPHSVLLTMGRPQVQKLRSLNNAVQKVCREFNLSDVKQREMFCHALESYEENAWSNREFRRLIESHMAKTINTSIQDIALRTDGYLQFHKTPLNQSPEIIDENYKGFDEIEWPEHRPNVVHVNSVYSVNTLDEGNFTPHNGTFKGRSVSEGRKLLNREESWVCEINQHSAKPTIVEIKLANYRKQAFEIACRVAKRYRFYEHSETKKKIVAHTGNWGIGYLVTDYPSPSQRGSINEAGIRDSLWWILLEVCDLQWATEAARPLTAKLIGNSEMRHFVKSGDAKTLYLHAKGKMKCTFPHLGLFNYCLRQLDEDSLNDLNRLFVTYRSLHHLAKSNNIHLFRLSTKRGSKQ